MPVEKILKQYENTSDQQMTNEFQQNQFVDFDTYFDIVGRSMVRQQQKGYDVKFEMDDIDADCQLCGQSFPQAEQVS